MLKTSTAVFNLAMAVKRGQALAAEMVKQGRGYDADFLLFHLAILKRAQALAAEMVKQVRGYHADLTILIWPA
jgi:hypothetical protein